MLYPLLSLAAPVKHQSDLPVTYWFIALKKWHIWPYFYRSYMPTRMDDLLIFDHESSDDSPRGRGAEFLTTNPPITPHARVGLNL